MLEKLISSLLLLLLQTLMLQISYYVHNRVNILLDFMLCRCSVQVCIRFTKFLLINDRFTLSKSVVNLCIWCCLSTNFQFNSIVMFIFIILSKLLNIAVSFCFLLFFKVKKLSNAKQILFITFYVIFKPEICTTLKIF